MNNDTPQYPPELQYIFSRLERLYQDNLLSLDKSKPDFETRSGLLKQWYVTERQNAMKGFYKAQERLKTQESEARDNLDVRALLDAKQEFRDRCKDILGEAEQAARND